MTREIDCLHPPDARFTTGKGIEKCAQCGKLEPEQDLQSRQDDLDARIGRIVRETRPDLVADFEKLILVLSPPPATSKLEPQDEQEAVPRPRVSRPRTPKKE